ncbi:hypothetical protein QBC34DRAFT_493819 [Podospora aff. communis PSN243]|uniref:N-acetyltransferase domain-containing protein n=1 Tax=Podospora aff. communis PSN243 TaxID=3040156 RepID=A0AAV9GS34_9PEZI|nr:hypothetical protein QBC34DRAFT_493819 [Podospora aff. communis PSN243]
MSDPTSPGNSDSGNWYRSPSANDHASLGSTSSPQLEVAWPKAPRTCTLAPIISPIGASDFVKATITETSDPKSPVVNFSASLNLWDSCTLGWGSAVAECNAVLVKRGWDKDLCDHDYDWKDSAFLELTRSAIPDISHSRWGVLDQYGQLRLRPGSHPPDHSRGNDRRGSSVDRSRILVINGIWVGEQNRRRKFGTRLVENVRDQARMLTPEVQGTVSVFVRCGSFIERHYGELGYFHQTFIPQLALSRSVWPLEKNDVALITQLREACCHRPKYDPEGLERFWRSLGFKRVDNFSWMAWSQDPNHPLLKLEVPDTPDGGPCNLRPGQLSGEHGDLVNNERKFEGSHLQDLYDLLSGDQGTATDHLFRKWLTGPCLDSTDVFGNNALHFAALTFHSPAIRHILSEKPDLALLRNCERCTPLEAMLSKMEEIRLQPRMVSKFMGFGQNMIDAVGALSGKEVFDLTEMRIDEYDLLRGHDRISKLGENIGPERMVLFDSTVRIKYGCTCGQCVNGYLSPRMISRLVFAAAPAFWDDIWEAFPVERRSLSPSVWESEDPTDIDKRLTGVAIVAIWESIFASLGGDSDSDDLWRWYELSKSVPSSNSLPLAFLGLYVAFSVTLATPKNFTES